MHAAKEIAVISVFTALLIGGQFVLSFVAGVEIVTVLLLCFCYSFGAVRGMLAATAFSLLRCIIFGFFPTVVILYLIYYNLFAAVFGFAGRKFNREEGLFPHALAVVLAVILTCIFTLSDDLITTAFYQMDRGAAVAYFYSSLPVMFAQSVSSFVTVLLLFRPLVSVFGKVNLQPGKRSKEKILY